MKRQYQLLLNGNPFQLEVEETSKGEIRITLDGETLTAQVITADPEKGRFRIAVGDQKYTLHLTKEEDGYMIRVKGQEYTAALTPSTIPSAPSPTPSPSHLPPASQPSPSIRAAEETVTPSATSKARPSRPGALEAPLPGVILDVRVKEGDQVKAGDVVLVLEAMKMANEIRAPTGGVIQSVYVRKGQSVEKGQPLIAIG